jgi:hypothetical protein
MQLLVGEKTNPRARLRKPGRRQFSRNGSTIERLTNLFNSAVFPTNFACRDAPISRSVATFAMGLK